MTLTYQFSTPGELLDKLRRERTRLRSAVTGRDTTEIADALFNFSVTGYHVSDWLKTRTTVGVPAVDNYVRSETALSACHDICTASKHVQITRYPSSTQSVYASADPGVPMPAVATELHGRLKVLMHDGTKFEVLEFADRVVAAWEKFCGTHGL